MSDRCFLCGEPATEPHHLCGRLTGDGPYLEPDLHLPSCGGCNKMTDHVWRVAGIAHLDDPILATLRRLALSSGQLADRDPQFTPPRRFWLALARCLTRIGDAWEERGNG